MMSFVARIAAATVSLFSSFAICYTSSFVFVFLLGRRNTLEWFVPYCWTAGWIGAFFGLLLCGIRPKWNGLPAILSLAAIAIVIPQFKLIDTSHSTLSRVLAWGTFFTHLPACALFGTFLAMPTYQWLRELIDE